MPKIKYDVLVRNGKDRFVVIPERDYQAMREQLEDDADFRAIEASKKRNAGKPLISHDEILRELGLSRGRRKRRG
jgi:PHD/YefM family antitoxin component YafN of YafNO toxin-antitoxin module